MIKMAVKSSPGQTNQMRFQQKVGGIKSLTRWEDLNTRITPTNKFFAVNHYNWPQLDAAKWQVSVTGQVEPLDLDPRQPEGPPASKRYLYP